MALEMMLLSLEARAPNLAYMLYIPTGGNLVPIERASKMLGWK